MSDPTEGFRRELQAEINAEQAARQALEKKYGQVWSTDEMRQEFTVEGFMAPFVSVTRKKDNAKGVMMFQHNPRFYFSFEKSE